MTRWLRKAWAKLTHPHAEALAALDAANARRDAAFAALVAEAQSAIDRFNNQQENPDHGPSSDRRQHP